MLGQEHAIMELGDGSGPGLSGHFARVPEPPAWKYWVQAQHTSLDQGKWGSGLQLHIQQMVMAASQMVGGFFFLIT